MGLSCSGKLSGDHLGPFAQFPLSTWWDCGQGELMAGRAALTRPHVAGGLQRLLHKAIYVLPITPVILEPSRAAKQSSRGAFQK